MQSGSYYPPPPGQDHVPKRYNPADYLPRAQADQYDNNEHGGHYIPVSYLLLVMPCFTFQIASEGSYGVGSNVRRIAPYINIMSHNSREFHDHT